jgi:hypothetical protein
VFVKQGLLEIKSVVVHFHGKAYNPGRLLAYQLAEGQLIRELKLGVLNQNRIRKWVKSV